jgi:hypothetical protein
LIAVTLHGISVSPDTTAGSAGEREQGKQASLE